MKLFVWESVLADYTSGVAFAFAKTAEEAKAAIIKHTPYCDSHWNGVLCDGVEPRVYGPKEGPVGYAIYGGS